MVAPSSNQFASASALGDVGLPGDHGLPHSADIGASDVLRPVHLAVGCDALPRVGPVALLLHLLVVHLLALLVRGLAQLHLLRALPLPLDQLIATLSLAIALSLLLCLLLGEQGPTTLLLLRLYTLYTLTLLVI